MFARSAARSGAAESRAGAVSKGHIGMVALRIKTGFFSRGASGAPCGCLKLCSRIWPSWELTRPGGGVAAQQGWLPLHKLPSQP